MTSKKRWKPKDRGQFWYVDQYGYVQAEFYYESDLDHGQMWKFGNSFRTRKSAERARVGISKVMRGRKKG